MTFGALTIYCSIVFYLKQFNFLLFILLLAGSCQKILSEFQHLSRLFVEPPHIFFSRRLMSKSFNNSELRAAVSWCSKQVLVHFQKCKHWAEITLGEECVQQLYLSSPQPQCRAWRSEEPCISRAHTASPGCSQTLDLWSNIRWTHKCILM